MAASSQRPKPRASRAQLTTQFTTVVGMSLTLFMVGMLGMAALFGQWASLKLQQHVHIQVHLQRELSQVQIDGARLAVTADSAVAQASYLDPAAAAAQLEQELGESFVEFLGYVPLPPVIDVVVRPDHAQPAALAQAASRFEVVPGVAEVVWNEGLLQSIHDTLDAWFPALAAVCTVCLLVALALLNNTIRLTVFARRFLIRNMQLVGAKPGMIRRPFIVQGLVLGLGSGLLAFAAMMGTLTLLKAQMGPLDPTILGLLAGSLLTLGGVLGAGFSGVAVNRYLHADLSKLH